MACTLVVAILAIQSSYAQNLERPLPTNTATPDTVQWWISDNVTWRIRTFAVDHDIHTYKINKGNTDMISLANKNNIDNFGDVISNQYNFVFDNCLVENKEMIEFKRAGLRPTFDTPKEGFIFWNPDSATYRSISRPVK